MGTLLRAWHNQPQGGEPRAIDSKELPTLAEAGSHGNSSNETQVSPNEVKFTCPDPISGQDTQARIDGTLEAFETSALETPRNDHLSGRTTTYDDVEKLVIEIFTFKKSFCRPLSV